MTRASSAWLTAALAALALLVLPPAQAQESGSRVYENRLTPIKDPKPLLADHPEFIEPIRDTARFEAPALVVDEGADLAAR